MSSEVWLKIEAPRGTLQMFRDQRAAEYMDSGLPKRGMLLSISPLHDGTGGENLFVNVALQNRSGEASALFLVPPIAATVTIYDGAESVFAGVITQISMNTEACTLGIEA